MKSCFSCGRETDIDGKPARGDACHHCGADLKVCRNCRFYDEAAYNECREPQAERIVDKDRANFCEYFAFKESGNDPVTEKDDPMSRLNALFGRS
ncbi:MAG: hypothetical protein KKE17_10445 [Proteobacteria bacterium]|nr:hypothetical protein [Pseudomonadota bacterium]MBU1710410.1 hypothetical protein [Pseudomonadota bacterium]